MAGSADRVDVWVLLEYRPVWRARPLLDSGLDPAILSWLDDGLTALANDGLKARPQLVRQPELDSDQVRLMVGVRERLAVFSGQGYGFLKDVDLAAVAREPDAYPLLDRPRYFVCTNGQRDVCCARFGLPTYTALREQVGDRAWQITHLGGHRFAPNVLVLPQGALYGRVAADSVPAFVAGVEAGKLVFPMLRGRPCHPPAVQAAEAMVGRQGLVLEGVQGDDDLVAVRFRNGREAIEVGVRRAVQPVMVLKSCGDRDLEPVYPYLPAQTESSR